jgi:hypothetical protein
LLLRVTLTANGRFGAEELSTVTGMVALLRPLGIDVVFLAMDGDRGLDAHHKRTLYRYVSAESGAVPTLSEADRMIAESSDGNVGIFYGWICVVVSDFLHLAKAVRFRLCKWLIAQEGSSARGS